MKLELTAAARIRFVVGCLAITLAAMEYIEPSSSGRWSWLSDALNDLMGPQGFVISLVLIGIAFILFSLIESIISKGDGE